MCGIAGYIYLDGRALTREQDERVLTAMGDAIHHRGPDDTQLMIWDNVGFVFKRLSIVDLSTGRQPFDTPDGRICAMINGEIYNHQELRPELKQRYALSTQSDCEVVPYLYLDRGLSLFEPVNGMFAAALLDRQEKRVLLARDRIGIKPLFYCLTDAGKVLVFASELKALFAHPSVPRQFNWSAALARQATCDTRPHELSSYFRGIDRIPAGGILNLDLRRGQFNVHTYWQLPTDRSSEPVRPVSHYIEKYRDLLDKSVRLRLMADVGYGLFLSGGIDSAAIAALAARVTQFPTFSVFSRSTLGNGDAEASFRVARHLNLPNHQVMFDHLEANMTPGDWREILWSCELFDITAEQLFKYHLHGFAKERYPNLKVILLGQGSDEYAGGYMNWMTGREGPWNADNWRDLDSSLRAIEAQWAATDAGLLAGYLDLITQGVLDRSFFCEAAKWPLGRETWDLYVDYYRQNIDYHLWQEDRTASAHAIENRVPFLDHRLLTFLAKIPVEHHAELFVDKRILRMAVADLLPDDVTERPKGYFFYGKHQHHAFRIMLSVLTANSGELIDQALAGSDSTGGPLHANGLKSLVSRVAQDPTHKDLNRLLFLVNMGLLADMAGHAESPPPFREKLPVYELGAEEFEQIVARSKAQSEADIADDVVVSFPAGAALVEVKQSSAGGLAPWTWHIVNGGRIVQEVTSPAVATFLMHVDGQKSLSQIVADNRLNLSRVRKYLRQALEQNILEPVS